MPGPRPNNQDSRGGILLVDGGATPDHLAADLMLPPQQDKGVTADGWVPPADTQPAQASTVVLAITGMT